MTWIKVRSDLHGDPAVIALSSALGIPDTQIVGCLHRFWSWADQQSSDGHAPGVTHAWIDGLVSVPGFADELSKVGWLEANGSGIAIPNWEYHLSESAKKRAIDTRRQQIHRGLDASRKQRDKNVTREEKRRSNNPHKPPRGGEVFHKDTDEICDHFDTALRWWRPKATNKPRSIQNRRAVSKLLSEHGVSRERLIDVIGHVFGACSKKPSATDYVPDPGSSFNWRINTQSAKKLLKHWDALDAMYSESVNGRAVV